jgi:hypothetical protein
MVTAQPGILPCWASVASRCALLCPAHIAREACTELCFPTQLWCCDERVSHHLLTTSTHTADARTTGTCACAAPNPGESNMGRSSAVACTATAQMHVSVVTNLQICTTILKFTVCDLQLQHFSMTRCLRAYATASCSSRCTPLEPSYLNCPRAPASEEVGPTPGSYVLIGVLRPKQHIVIIAQFG